MVAPSGSAGSGDCPLELHVFAHDADVITEGVLVDPATGSWWWIERGVPRLLAPSLYRSRAMEDRYTSELSRLGLRPAPPRPRDPLLALQLRTIDRFGDEWIRFRDWGHLEEAPGGDEIGYRGGLWAHTLGAFAGKTFVHDRIDGRVCLDAGCGNGRFTAAALHHGAERVLAIDLGWGVEATYERFFDDPRVVVVQGSLFDLPLTRYEVAYSIGVLMHTGDACRAFHRIADGLDAGGAFAVRMYHRGNAVYEVLDRTVRACTTRTPKLAQRWFSAAMAGVGRAVHGIDKRFSDGTLADRAYRLFHTWPTLHHNVDWWSAPIATHHTLPEVIGWAHDAGLDVVMTDQHEPRDRFGFWEWPEALTALFAKPAPVPVHTTSERMQEILT
ncbi:MAG: hypothetical protein Tsb0013_17190 [Phycisphaerales bacterium]